jgi:glycosyltransferase involved in cell wall biosynthesis
VTKTGVLQLVDSLASGGAEHVAVMLANNLPQGAYRAYLCASRKTGPLESEIRPHVAFLALNRRGLLDLRAIFRLAKLVRREQIGIIHAHTTSLFLGTAICLLDPKHRLVWHDHIGRQEIALRPKFLYSPFARRADAVFAVTRELADWSVQSLGVRREHVRYLPNFVELQQSSHASLELPGQAGKRMVCVANIRAQKDHLTLLRAFAQVVRSEPDAHLILVGAENEAALAKQAREESQQLGLASTNLTWLGPRQDVPSILANCDIGVLSSVSEAFPVALLEYGRAGLAVVATRVGECADILQEGEAGLLVSPSNPDALAAALLHLLESPYQRTDLGRRLNERVKKDYCAETVVGEVCQVYEQILH